MINVFYTLHKQILVVSQNIAASTELSKLFKRFALQRFIESLMFSEICLKLQIIEDVARETFTDHGGDEYKE